MSSATSGLPVRGDDDVNVETQEDTQGSAPALMLGGTGERRAGRGRGGWRWILYGLWSARGIFVQVTTAVLLMWALAPLRDAARLPNPAIPAYTPEPPDLQSAVLMAGAVLTPGTEGSARIIVLDPRTGTGVPEAGVRLSLGRADDLSSADVVWVGETDERGVAHARYIVPKEVGSGALAWGAELEGWALTADVTGPVGSHRRAGRLSSDRAACHVASGRRSRSDLGQQCPSSGRRDRRPGDSVGGSAGRASARSSDRSGAA